MTKTIIEHLTEEDQVVVEALKTLGGTATAVKLLEKLVDSGYPRRDGQLAIQRTIERGMLRLNSDWKVQLTRSRAAA